MTRLLTRTTKETIRTLMLLVCGSTILGAFCGFLSQVDAILAGIGSVAASLVINILTDLLRDNRKNEKE